MKIIYSNGAIGTDIPYQHHPIKTKEDFELSKRVYQINETTQQYEFVGISECYIEWEKGDINYIAGEYIRKYYPEYKQLNIIRSGTAEEQNKMTAFIDAVRTWSNSESPDPWNGTLEGIVPTE